MDVEAVEKPPFCVSCDRMMLSDHNNSSPTQGSRPRQRHALLLLQEVVGEDVMVIGALLVYQVAGDDGLSMEVASASRKRGGWRGSIASQTAVIWCGSASTIEVCTARIGSECASGALRRRAGRGARRHRSPGLVLLGAFEARLVVAVEQHVGHPPGRILVGQLDGFGAIPVHVDDRDQ